MPRLTFRRFGDSGTSADGTKISSCAMRQMIASGDKAPQTGKVVRGAPIAEKLSTSLTQGLVVGTQNSKPVPPLGDGT